MNTYESKQKQIRKEQGAIYDRISDLRNAKPYVDAILDGARSVSTVDAIPKDIVETTHASSVQDIEFTDDSVSFKAGMVGKVTMRIVDRSAPKMLKFGVEGVPVQANLWIQLVGVSENDTRMKVTVKADIPLMLKPMIGNKLEEGVERFADMLADVLNNG